MSIETASGSSTALRERILTVLIPALVTIGFMIEDGRLLSEPVNAAAWLALVLTPFVFCALTFRTTVWTVGTGFLVLIFLVWMHVFMRISLSSTDSLAIILYLPASFLVAALGLAGDYYLGRRRAKTRI